MTARLCSTNEDSNGKLEVVKPTQGGHAFVSTKLVADINCRNNSKCSPWQSSFAWRQICSLLLYSYISVGLNSTEHTNNSEIHQTNIMDFSTEDSEVMEDIGFHGS